MRHSFTSFSLRRAPLSGEVSRQRKHTHTSGHSIRCPPVCRSLRPRPYVLAAGVAQEWRARTSKVIAARASFVVRHCPAFIGDLSTLALCPIRLAGCTYVCVCVRIGWRPYVPPAARNKFLGPLAKGGAKFKGAPQSEREKESELVSVVQTGGDRASI